MLKKKRRKIVERRINLPKTRTSLMKWPHPRKMTARPKSKKLKKRWSRLSKMSIR